MTLTHNRPQGSAAQGSPQSPRVAPPADSPLESPLSLEQLHPRALRQVQMTATGSMVLGGSSAGATAPRKLGLKQKAHLKAAYYWLHRYQVPAEATPWQRLEPYVEAHDQLAQAEARSLMGQLLAQPPALPPGGDRPGALPQPWHEQLGELGLYHQQIRVYSTALDTIEGRQRWQMLQQLGTAYGLGGQLQKATDLLQEALAELPPGEDPSLELELWHSLGYVRLMAQDLATALVCCHRQLALGEQLQDALACARAWSALARAYSDEHPRQCLRCVRKAQVYGAQLPDHQVSLSLLSSLGKSLAMLGQHESALDQGQRLLAVALDQGHLYYQCAAWEILGISYVGLGDADQADSALGHALALAQQERYGYQELAVLNGLGVLYSYVLHRHSEALGYFQPALALQSAFQETPVLHCHLAQCYRWLGQIDRATFHYNQALALYPQAETSFNKAMILTLFALWHWQQGQVLRCFWTLVRCFWILPPWQSVNGALTWRRAKEVVGDSLRNWLKTWWFLGDRATEQGRS